VLTLVVIPAIYALVKGMSLSSHPTQSSHPTHAAAPVDKVPG